MKKLHTIIHHSLLLCGAVFLLLFGQQYSHKNITRTILGSIVLLFAFLFLHTETASAQAFRTTWITTDGTITIPTTSASGTYNYNVTWTNLTNAGIGDGAATGRTGDFTITGLTNGDTYEIAITGIFPHFYMNGGTQRLKLRTIEEWGDIGWKTMYRAFYGCKYLTYNATDVPNLDDVTNMNYMFGYCSEFNGDIGNWNTQNITNMAFMFGNCVRFNGDITTWDTRNVRNMNGMFQSTPFNQDIRNWNTGSVTNMASMFKYAPLFNQPIGNWNTENVTGMSDMFSGAISFNQPIGNWNTGSVTDMSYMFYNATSFNQPIGNWNTGSVTDMSYMFYNPTNATSFNQPIGNWNTGSVTNMNFMFYNVTSFNQPIGNWNTENVTNMSHMFVLTTSFNQPIGNWNTGSVTDMSYMFNNAISFNQPIGNWNTGSVTDMSYMFYNAMSFNQPIGNWNTGSVTDMNFMFYRAYSFNQPIGNWNTENVTGMRGMFYNATSFNQPIGNWNTENVTNMSHMFALTTSFNQPIGNWNISNVSYMDNMLDNCGMNTVNYDATLIGWSSQNVQLNVSLGASALTYCNGEVARNILVSSHNWIITGDLLGGVLINNTTLPQNQFDLCVNTSTTLEVDGNGIITWYNSPTNPVSIHTGSSFVTPILTADSTYFYVQNSVIGCGVSNRLPILVTTLAMQNITPPQNQYGVCLNTQTTLEVEASGTVYWYDSPISTTAIHTGSTFTTPIITQDSTYFYAFDSIAGCNNERVELLVTTLSSLNAISKTNYTVYLDSNGQLEINAILLDSISSAGCGNTITSYLFDDTELPTRSFSCADSIQNVVLRVTDSNGNIETSPTTIYVRDTIPPTFTTQTLTVDFGTNQTVVAARDFLTTLGDNCTDSTAISVLFNNNGRDSLTLYCGNNTIRNIQLRITDRSGNVVIHPVEIIPTSSSYDFNINVSATPFRPNQFSYIDVLATNHFCAPKSGQVKITLPTNVIYISSSITPNNINGNILTWNVTDLNYSRSFLTKIKVQTASTANIGNQVCVGAEITPITQYDVRAFNNTKYYCFPVVNSYDPNDKQVYPQGVCEQRFTQRNDQPLTYTIRFQNTGNAPALQVAILDTLSQYLDINTLNIVAASHPMVLDSLADSVVRFRFDDINLPDSLSDPEGSQGFVIFEIKEKNGNPDTIRIENTSHIYFDTNPAIVTNTVLNTMVTTVPSCSTAPADNEICEAPSNLRGEALNASKVRLTWQMSSSAITYEIYRNNIRIATIPAQLTSFVDSLLEDDTRYTYSLKAICGNSTALTRLTTTVRTKLAVPTLLSQEVVCIGAKATIRVQSSGSVYHIYASNDAQTPLFETTNAAITTPIITDTTTFYISVFNNFSESERLAVTIATKEAFEAKITQGSDVVVCESTTTLTALEVANATTYTWFRAGVQVGNGQALTVSKEGEYTLQITKDGCSQLSQPTQVRLNAERPAVQIAEGQTISFCEKGILHLQNPNSINTYQWTKNGEVVGSGNTLEVTQSGTYFIKAIQNSCEAVDSIVVKVVAPPSDLTLTASQTRFCQGENTTLSTNNNPAYSYEWIHNGQQIQEATLATFTTAESGVYQVRVRSAAGCETLSEELTITIEETPTASLTLNNRRVEVTAEAEITAVTWLWEETAVANLENQTTITPPQAGLYKAIVTYANGCTYETQGIDVEETVLGSEEEQDDKFRLYPNPSEGSFNIDFGSEQLTNTELLIVDALGRIIQRHQLAKGAVSYTIQATNLAKGVYLVQLNSQDKSFSKKLIIQ